MPKWNWLGVFAMGNSSGHNNTMTIPPGKGPHKVGCSDLMVGHTVNVSMNLNCVCTWLVCVSLSHLKNMYFFKGTFLRLYYPCQASENPQLPDWVPCREYFNGLADFMKINRALSERIFNYLFGNFFFLFFYRLFITEPFENVNVVVSHRQHTMPLPDTLRCG